MKQLTLQNRIISLMVLACVLFISTFVFIQINSQVANVTIFNSFSAKLNGFIVKNDLQKILNESSNKTAEEIQEELNRRLIELVVNRVISEGNIIDTANYRIIASTSEDAIDSDANWKDTKLIETMLTEEVTEKWFETLIDKENNIIYLYIPLKSENKTYIVKTEFPLSNIKEALSSVYKPAVMASILIVIAVIILGVLLSKMVIGPIKVLNNATKEIAEGRLEYKVSINTNDELEELAKTFNEMSQALIKMKNRAEDANPLTKLPGNTVIRDAVEDRIKLNKKFTVIHSDLGNFKAYNDHYGFAQGDEAIKLCANVLQEAVIKNGNKEDLVGHGGGDDFILVTTPEKAENIANYIIKEFDQRILTLYNEEDKKVGYIIAHSRKGELVKFPIMTISLSGVSNSKRPLSSFAEITNIDAEIKHIVKEEAKSMFLMDRRNS